MVFSPRSASSSARADAPLCQIGSLREGLEERTTYVWGKISRLIASGLSMNGLLAKVRLKFGTRGRAALSDRKSPRRTRRADYLCLGKNFQIDCEWAQHEWSSRQGPPQVRHARTRRSVRSEVSEKDSKSGLPMFGEKFPD